MKHLIAIAGVLLCAAAPLAEEQDDVAEIRALLIESYVDGIYINRDEDAVRKGFHPDFVLHVLDHGQLIQAPLDMWLARLQLDGEKSRSSYDYSFESVDVTGTSAVVKMEIHEDSRHLYTDYFGLYKFADGWMIVNKIFSGHN